MFLVQTSHNILYDQVELPVNITVKIRPGKKSGIASGRHYGIYII